MAEPSTRRMRRATLAVAAASVLLATALVVGRPLAPNAADPSPADPPPAAAVQYQCAMHPQIVSDHPGTCPICQMKLQRVETGSPAGVARTADPEAAGPRERRLLFYRHPMRPDVRSSVPAKDEMGMDYVPVYADDVADGEGPGSGPGAPRVNGRAGFTLSPERQQLIGVKKARVEKRRLESRIRAAGRVAYDPRLYQAIVEYREALRSRAAVARSSSAEAHEGAEGIVRSATLKLRQQGLSEAQVRDLTRSTADPTNLLLGGRSAWIYAQVYEFEVGQVAPGQTMEITLPAAPDRRFTARVAAIDPILDPATRTARVRALVADSDGLLRPESYVNVEIVVPLGERLALPREAILDAGERPLVFVVDARGRFEPREVELGAEARGYREVLAGVSAGEEVVTSANFLIDSESRFRAAVESYRAAPAAPTPPAAPAAPADRR